MQAFDFTGETYEPVAKPEPKQSKGGFYGFGKNSKSKIVTLSKNERDEKNRKLEEYRNVIGRTEGRDATDLSLANEVAIDVALKRANQKSKASLVDVKDVADKMQQVDEE